MKPMKLFWWALWLLCASIMWQGYVLFLMWNWFVVRLHVPVISVAEGIGLALLVRMFTQHDVSKDVAEDVVWNVAMLEIGVPIIILVAGYIFHFFV